MIHAPSKTGFVPAAGPNIPAVQLRASHRGRRKIRVIKRWIRLQVASHKLGLTGTIDTVVLTENGLAVVEYKRSTPPKKPLPSHIYQTAAYAMLAEEYFKRPVRKFYICYDDGRSSKIFEITLTRSIREHVLWTVKRIQAIVEGEEFPEWINTGKCASCGYYKLCRGV